MGSLVHEVSEEVFSLARWAFYGLFIAISLSILAISLPVVYSIFSDVYKDRAAIATLERKLNDLEQKVKEAEPGAEQKAMVVPKQAIEPTNQR